MKAYIVLQDIYGEGNFGDTELQHTKIHGIFSTAGRARNKLNGIEKSFHNESGFRDGKIENAIYIEKYEIDKQ